MNCALPPVLISEVFELIEEDVIRWAKECMFELELQTRIVTFLNPLLDDLELKKCLIMSGNMDAIGHFRHTNWMCWNDEEWIWYFLNARPKALEFLFVLNRPNENCICQCLCSNLMLFGRLCAENLQIIIEHVCLNENAKRNLFWVACTQQDIHMLNMQLNVLKWRIHIKGHIPISPMIWPILEPHIVDNNILFAFINPEDIQCLTPFVLENLRTLKVLPNPKSIGDSNTFWDCFICSRNMHAADFFWTDQSREIVSNEISHAFKALTSEQALTCRFIG